MLIPILKRNAPALAALLILASSPAFALSPAITFTTDIPRDLRVGFAGHAFDHLGGIPEQADAAVASGANIIYDSGVGVFGYQGLPTPEVLAKERKASAAYVRHAKKEGVRLAIGYVCATSIVKLNTFDKNWSAEFRKQFHSAPRDWRQVDRNGNPLPSWYGGDYNPACMNNPDWRTYEKFMVRQQFETGHDGIFFDNPTVHPQGCYCQFCMAAFEKFLHEEKVPLDAATNSVAGLRDLAVKRPADFQRFRTTVARDFLYEIKSFATKLNRHALITCNNSLNSPGMFFAQSRMYGYNINEFSKAEDLIVVEDMETQARVVGGQIREYSPIYQCLHAIGHNKPLVAIALADADYHTPPNLVRLAMAEAAANNASYLSWPTWPEDVRAKMAAAIRPEADFLRANEKYLNDTVPRQDVVLFLPFRRWQETDTCIACNLAAMLSRSNVQYCVAAEENFFLWMGWPLGIASTMPMALSQNPIPALIENRSILNPKEKQIVADYEKLRLPLIIADDANWLESVKKISSSIRLEAPPTVRAIVQDQKVHRQLGRTLVHLLNLNIEKNSSFTDTVHPASDVRVSVRLPFSQVHSVRALTADKQATSGKLKFSTRLEGHSTIVETVLPRLDISTILVVE